MIDIKHKIGCGRANTISFLLVLVIFKSLALVIYLIAGSLYNQYRWGLHGMDSLPNVDLWRSLLERAKTLPEMISARVSAFKASKSTATVDAAVTRAESEAGDYPGV
jgi:hypothetical protein